MKLPTRLLFYLIISFCFYHCSNNITKNKELVKNKLPEFADNGKTVDSLKTAYNCESIEYENWAGKKASDSCLTVSLINSTKVPSGNNIDSNALQMKRIALTIKKALTKPQTYKSLYIIFIKNYIVNGRVIKIHSPGLEILSTEL